jgi:hypothetical protein
MSYKVFFIATIKGVTINKYFKKETVLPKKENFVMYSQLNVLNFP